MNVIINKTMIPYMTPSVNNIFLISCAFTPTHFIKKNSFLRESMDMIFTMVNPTTLIIKRMMAMR